MIVHSLGYYKKPILTGANKRSFNSEQNSFNSKNVKIVTPISALSKNPDYTEGNLAVIQANASYNDNQKGSSDNLIDVTNLNENDVLNVFYLKRLDSKQDNSLKPKISGSNIAFLSEV